MIQLYFLSIFCNTLTGYLLFANDDTDTQASGATGTSAEPAGRKFPFGFSLTNPTFNLVIGIISMVVGILKFLLAMNDTPFFGDFIPALFGLIAGFVLIFGVYRVRNSKVAENNSKLDRLGEIMLRNRKVLGMVLLVAALLHFLFPQALFL